MSVAVNYKYNGSGGILNSKGLGLGLDVFGAVTGNPAIIAAGAAKTLQGTPAGGVLSAYNTASDLSGKGSQTNPQINQQNVNDISQNALGNYQLQTDPQLNPQDNMNALNRKYASLQGGQ